MDYLCTFCGRVSLCSWHSDSFVPFVFHGLQQNNKYQFQDWESDIVKETGDQNRENSLHCLDELTMISEQSLREMCQGPECVKLLK